MEIFHSLIGGASYGLTSVLVGQPLDSVKTMMQSREGYLKLSTTQSIKKLAQTEGIKGFYRGGTPIFLGATMFRSAQFAVYDASFVLISKKFPQRSSSLIDWRISVAGLCGGFGRGLVETPFEYIKIRQQVNSPWRFFDAYKGCSITLVRNSFLFCFFSTYLDILRRSYNLNPFLLGAFAANFAWLTIWPLDVLKTNKQSGLYSNKSTLFILKDVYSKGNLFRGIVPGVVRSTIANGSSMFVMTNVKKWLKN